MFVILLMVFLYMMDIIEVSPTTNFALTCASLLFSVSSVVDTYAKENTMERKVKFIIDTLAITMAVILPNLKSEEVLKFLMDNFDTNVLLLLALFFTMASQWAAEIKQKDIKRRQR